MILYLLGFLNNLFNPKVSKLALISNTKISRKAKICRIVKLVGSSIDDYSYVGDSSILLRTTVGRFCSIAENCRIGLARHTLSFLSTSPIFTEIRNGTGTTWVESNEYASHALPITIGNDVWIGANVIIKDGITIGNGVVIGAGTIVTKDIPPYAIVAGCPSRIIRYRFAPEVIEALQSLQWWNLPEEKLKKALDSFHTNDINQAIQHLKTICKS